MLRIPGKLAGKEDQRLTRGERGVQCNRLAGPLVKDIVAVFIKFVNVEFPEGDGGIIHKVTLSVLKQEIGIAIAILQFLHQMNRHGADAVADSVAALLYLLRNLVVDGETIIVQSQDSKGLLIVRSGEVNCHEILEECCLGLTEGENRNIAAVAFKSIDNHLVGSINKNSGGTLEEDDCRV